MFGTLKLHTEIHLFEILKIFKPQKGIPNRVYFKLFQF